MDSRGWSAILLYVVFIAVNEVRCQVPEIITPLENQAGLSQSSVVLYVRARKYADTDYLAFFYTPETSQGPIQIWKESEPDNVIDPSKFSVVHEIVEDDGTSIVMDYNLTVTLTETSMGVQYSAAFLLNIDIVTRAYIIVLETLSCPPAGETKEEQQEVTVPCSTFYYGYKAPVMEWYTEDWQLIPGNVITEDDETSQIWATVNFTAAAEYDEMQMYCHLSFETDVDEAAAPEFTDQCSTYYLVEHGVTNIKTYPDKDDFPGQVVQVTEGDWINCSASGRPDPTYYWSYDNGAIQSGQNLPITGDMVRDGNPQIPAQCIATNTLTNGQERTTNINISFIASPLDVGPPASAGTAGWVIAISIIIPLLVIGILAGVAYYMLVVKKKDSKPPLHTPAVEASRPPYDNKAYQTSGGRPPQQSVPMSGSGNPPGSVPLSGYGGLTQQGYPGKGSPGFADLGVKHISGSHASLSSSLNQSNDSLPDPSRYGGNVNVNPKGSAV